MFVLYYTGKYVRYHNGKYVCIVTTIVSCICMYCYFTGKYMSILFLNIYVINRLLHEILDIVLSNNPRPLSAPELKLTGFIMGSQVDTAGDNHTPHAIISNYHIGKCSSVLLPHWKVYVRKVFTLTSICLYLSVLLPHWQVYVSAVTSLASICLNWHVSVYTFTTLASICQ